MSDASALQCPSCDHPVADPGAQSCPECGASLVICGRYRLRSPLGGGGMGRVYEATDLEQGDRRVAVKIVGIGEGVDWKVYELFERSCKTLKHLDEHAGLPGIYDFEQRDDGDLCLVREVFDGGTLEQRIDEGRRLSPDRVQALLRELLETIDFLHTQAPPILHRDIKPGNIMFRTEDDWKPVLVDFDTMAAPEGKRSGLTMVGTPGYTAPEQLIAAPEPASDLYSLGATMLFVATHVEPDELPRAAGRFDLSSRLDSLGPVLAKVIKRMVEPDLGQRFASAQEVLEALRERTPNKRAPAERASKPAPVVSRTVSVPEASSSQGSVARWLVPTAIACAAIGFVLVQRGPQTRASTPPQTAADPDAPAPPANALEEIERELKDEHMSGMTRYSGVTGRAVIAYAAGATGDRDKAQSLLTEASAQLEELPDGWQKAVAMGTLGCAYSQLGDAAKGDELVDGAKAHLDAQLTPYDAMLINHVFMARRCFELDDRNHAAKFAGWATEAVGKLERLSWYNKANPQIVELLAVLVQLGDADAIDALFEAMTTSMGADWVLGQALIAEALWKVGEKDRAGEMLDALVPAEDDIEELAFVGHANAVVGRNDVARTQIDAALEILRSDGERLYYYREEISAGYVRLGDIERGKAAMNNPERWGATLVREGRYDEAMDCENDCPRFPGNFDLSLALAHMGRYEEAVEWARTVSGRRPFMYIALATAYRLEHSADE